LKIELIEWDDAYSGNDWESRGRLDKGLPRCLSIGIKEYEDDKVVVLIPNISLGGNALHPINIPKGCIARRRILKVR
jgi:hypothetical protein